MNGGQWAEHFPHRTTVLPRMPVAFPLRNPEQVNKAFHHESPCLGSALLTRWSPAHVGSCGHWEVRLLQPGATVESSRASSTAWRLPMCSRETPMLLRGVTQLELLAHLRLIWKLWRWRALQLTGSGKHLSLDPGVRVSITQPGSAEWDRGHS